MWLGYATVLFRLSGVTRTIRALQLSMPLGNSRVGLILLFVSLSISCLCHDLALVDMALCEDIWNVVEQYSRGLWVRILLFLLGRATPIQLPAMLRFVATMNGVSHEERGTRENTGRVRETPNVGYNAHTHPGVSWCTVVREHLVGGRRRRVRACHSVLPIVWTDPRNPGSQRAHSFFFALYLLWMCFVIWFLVYSVHSRRHGAFPL